MKLTIQIQMDNAAFFDDDSEEPRRNAEVARILHTLAHRIDGGWEIEDESAFTIMDTNGNRVGTATVEDEDKE